MVAHPHFELAAAGQGMGLSGPVAGLAGQCDSLPEADRGLPI
jgi:hypothetical protein